MTDILKKEERVSFDLRRLYSQHGYQRFRMARFEEYDLYVRNKDFLVSDQVITFSDRSGKLLALKPDVTLSIIKNVQDIPRNVQKLYYHENVYRTDKSSHNYKEIMQIGLECVGDLTALETAEVVLLAAESMTLMERPFVLDLSHMGLLSAVLEDCGVGKEHRITAMTLLHQKNTHQMVALCENAGCCREGTLLLSTLTTLSGKPAQVLPAVKKLLFTERQNSLLSELEQVCLILESQGFLDNINIDFSAGSQMKYYSGIVFCGYLQGIPNVVLSGGQYDALLKKMRKSSKAIGFAIYLDLLQRTQEQSNEYDVDTVLLYDENSDPAAVLKIAAELRKDTSVLIAATKPDGVNFRCLMEIKDGEAVLVEKYG